MRRLGAAPPAPTNFFAKLARFPSYFGRRELDRLERRDFRPPEPPLWCAAERLLRAAIADDPDNAGPRLRYAEWLDRERDPRGEFIRVQLALAELPEDMTYSPSRERLLMRERALLASHRDTWLAEVAPWAPTEATLTRGFVEDVTLTGRCFLSLGEGLFRTTPIRRVRLIAVAPYLAEVGKSPLFGRLRGLSLAGNQAGPDGIVEVTASPLAATLRELDLGSNRLGTDGVKALCAAKHLTALESLGLADNRVGGEMAAALLNVEHFGKITSIDLSSNAIGAEGAALIAARASLKRVMRLSLEGNDIGPRGVQVLASSPHLAEVRHLDVSDNRIGSAGVASLTLSKLRQLRSLRVGFNELGDHGARSLAGWRSLGELRYLDVAGNRLTDAGVRELLAGELPALERLDLSANHVGDGGFYAAVATGRVRELRMAANFVTDFGLRSALKLDAAAKLRVLDLGWNRLDDAGAVSLAESGGGECEELNLRGNRIGFAGALALAGAEGFTRLRMIDVGENPRIPPEALAALRERFGAALRF